MAFLKSMTGLHTGLACAATLSWAVLLAPTAAADSRSNLADMPAASAPPGGQPHGQPLAQRLPAAHSSQHAAGTGANRISFTATAGAIAITGAVTGDGRPLQGEIAYVAYRTDARDARSRPVVFAFNGGPGSASAWLHLGAMGPWRTGLEPETAPCKREDAFVGNCHAVPLLVENEESWLPFADLVFIDPVGTGFSRMIEVPASATAGEEDEHGRRPKRKLATERGGPDYFHSVHGDADSLARFISKWLARHDRRASPIVLVGESYGGFRAPKIARLLTEDHAIRLEGLVLVSPVLDFESRRGMFAPLHFVNLLPSLVATARERRGEPVSRFSLAEAEAYARGPFLTDLIRGPRDPEAVTRIADRIAAMTGLQAGVIMSHSGRLRARTFLSELDRSSNVFASLYDASVTRPRTRDDVRSHYYRDPFTGDVSPKLAKAMDLLYREKLGWHPGSAYRLQSWQVARAWQWPNSPNAAQSVDDLIEVIFRNDTLQVMTTHGFTDLVTPYFATEILMDQLTSPGRLIRKVYPGGHMYYSREASRRAFTADVRRMLQPESPPDEHRSGAL